MPAGGVFDSPLHFVAESRLPTGVRRPDRVVAHPAGT